MIKLSVVAIFIAVLIGSASEGAADADADAGADADAAPLPTSDPKPDIIPGRIQNNPVLLVYDLMASFVASLPILGVYLVEILGLGRR